MESHSALSLPGQFPAPCSLFSPAKAPKGTTEKTPAPVNLQTHSRGLMG